ncbi:1,4-dihydroxy-6-naphtoate synthase [Stieleria maiorica]|uniref:1,4-dihydroxy-6-naphtoate synthase n=1 Tax=Stieleria maiorica TaxID=2795974 RepID=A0A5B9MCC5_9BACT|nr:1,4-dihydroxy-6-naphthoate synthase [Stieleria maiorica]QEF96877.1 1,4-dihydroxy-6-naphtoate synthase [Stieleria maiorica]
MSERIRLGISTCPNDTFAFHALMNRLVDWRGLEFDIRLLDIQQLNDQLFAGRFDVAKCSFHAALLLSDSMVVLPSGSALGFGVGPLLLSSAADAESAAAPVSTEQVTLCPGQHTTATLLFRLFYPDSTRIEQVVFSEIMPRLVQNTANFGVCIHEGRFTWQDQGLGLVEDLGTRWENETRCPLPLGGLVGDTHLRRDVLQKVQAVVRDSLEFSLADPAGALETMRKYAQEFDDEVLMQHVRLYVNDWTVDLGAIGATALDRLNQKARDAGIIPRQTAGLKILS